MLTKVQRWFSPTRSESKNCIKVFLLAALITTIIFLPFIICDKGLFIFYGDYNVQQIPFYQYAHDAIRSGEVGWSWYTDLGSNFVGSYGFYLLGSPFFWLTIPFPSSWVPYLMAPLFILKFSIAATTSYAFIRRFTKTPHMAIIGAMMYAFSSFSIYNIFFNHFHEVIAFFPLLLIGLEELVMNNRKGLFAMAVALNVFTNYFFFAGQVAFLVLYFFLRCLCLDFRINLKKFGLLAAESIIGVLIALVLFLPCICSLMGNPRTDNMLTGFNMLFYYNPQRYGLILQSMFFPADMPARANFFPDSNAKWCSVAAWLPLFSMAGVLTFLREKRKHWLKTLIIVLITMSLVPILNSAFFAFNSSYYARWFYMMVLMMSLATVIVLENKKMDISFGIKTTFIITCLFAIIGIIPTTEDGKTTYFSAPGYPTMFWINVLIAILCIVIAAFILQKYRKSKTRLYRSSLIALCAIIVVNGVVQVSWGKMQNVDYVYRNVVDRGLNAEFQLDDSEFYRIDVYDGMDNWPMYWRMPTIQAFQSVVPASIMEFYPAVGVDRDVASRPEPKYYGLRELLSVKYIFAENNADNKKTNLDLPPNCVLYDNQNGFDIYENKNFIPMGFTYDSYITQEQFDDSFEDTRDRLLVNSILLDEEQIQKYSGLLEHYIGDTNISDEELTDICEDRRRYTCDTFETSGNGFDATITLKEENLVFFSVPYDKGWTATVNGEPVEIEKVNVGFMAVKCASGENTIEFHYSTPGLKLGFIGTIVGVALFLLYLLLCKKLEKRNPKEFAYNPKGHLEELKNDSLQPTRTEIYQEYELNHPNILIRQVSSSEKDTGLSDQDDPIDKT